MALGQPCWPKPASPRPPRRSACAQAAALRAESQARHLPVHGRRAEPSGAVRLQAATREVRRHAAARRTAERLPRRLHQSEFQAARPEVQIRQIWPERRRASELLPHLAKIVDDIAIVKSMVTDAFNHAPGQLLMNTGTQQFGRPSMGAWVTYGLGQRIAGSAGFRGVELRQEGTERRRFVLGQRLSADRLSRRASSAAAATRCCISRTRAASTSELQRDSLDTIRTLNQNASRRHRRSGNRHPHQLVRDGVSDAIERAGVDGPLEGAAKTFWRCTARSRASRRSPTIACWPGGWSSAACASCSCIHEAWDQHGNLTHDINEELPRHRSSLRRSGHRSEAARPARRHAGHLGRRIRPHADGAGRE